MSDEKEDKRPQKVRKLDALRERAEAGELTKDDMAFLQAREGVPTFDALRRTADDAVFADDEDEDEDDGPYADLSYAELKSELDDRDIVYKGNASADELRARLVENDA